MAYNLVFTIHKRRSYRRALYSASGFHWFDFQRIVLLCASDNGCHSNSDVIGEQLSMFSNSFLCASNKFPSTFFLCGTLRGILMTKLAIRYSLCIDRYLTAYNKSNQRSKSFSIYLNFLFSQGSSISLLFTIIIFGLCLLFLSQKLVKCITKAFA